MESQAVIKPDSKKILFATYPSDGHVNPLTSLAVSLKKQGYDVRWYTSKFYAEKMRKLDIPLYSLNKAFDVMTEDITDLSLQIEKHKSDISKFQFVLTNVFILRGPEFYSDILEIYKSFPFDLIVADILFTAIPMIKEHLGKPVISIGVAPLVEDSKDIAPVGMGLHPPSSFFQKMKYSLIKTIAHTIVLRKLNGALKKMLSPYNIRPDKSLFDTLAHKSDLLLQSGTPGFEYYRSDLSKNVRFIGPLLPYRSESEKTPWYDDRVTAYEKVILVTQGTVEKDVNKIIVPTLEAFKESNYLVIATTGGSETSLLKEKYSLYKNIIVEDNIPFGDVMPFAHVYITNGGYGGVMLGIQNDLPLIVAGVHEGKNEICARVGYFKLGIDLRTETPTPNQIKASVTEIFFNNEYKNNVSRLNSEFKQYNPQELFLKYVNELLAN